MFSLLISTFCVFLFGNIIELWRIGIPSSKLLDWYLYWKSNYREKLYGHGCKSFAVGANIANKMTKIECVKGKIESFELN
mmetsp:Transcript_40251/g.60367  ORF Transcript_40251/g.60367 Transcript_40251/m.60367 type:complete len:80 (-) Transcript_40251:98-337(-)